MTATPTRLEYKDGLELEVRRLQSKVSGGLGYPSIREPIINKLRTLAEDIRRMPAQETKTDAPESNRHPDQA